MRNATSLDYFSLVISHLCLSYIDLRRVAVSQNFSVLCIDFYMSLSHFSRICFLAFAKYTRKALIMMRLSIIRVFGRAKLYILYFFYLDILYKKF